MSGSSVALLCCNSFDSKRNVVSPGGQIDVVAKRCDQPTSLVNLYYSMTRDGVLSSADHETINSFKVPAIMRIRLSDHVPSNFRRKRQNIRQHDSNTSRSVNWRMWHIAVWRILVEAYCGCFNIPPLDSAYERMNYLTWQHGYEITDRRAGSLRKNGMDK